MPEFDRLLTLARSASRESQAEENALVALSRPFTGARVVGGRSYRARVGFLARHLRAEDLLNGRPGQGGLRLMEALSLTQQRLLTSGNRQGQEPAPTSGQYRRWRSLWLQACRELDLKSKSPARTQAWVHLPRWERVWYSSSRWGSLEFVSLAGGLFALVCPQGGLHLPRNFVQPAVGQSGTLLWNWPAWYQPQWSLEPLTMVHSLCDCPARAPTWKLACG